jgi:hypothetical protein
LQIFLQEQSDYENESKARSNIAHKILDYNQRRPNEGNGGFAPLMLHLEGRSLLMELDARRKTDIKRRIYWKKSIQAEKITPREELT